MRTSRRNFIKTGTLAVAGTTMFSDKLFAAAVSSSSEKLTGLQLYSVRDDMKKAPLDTLKKISAMGYRYVEHASYVNRKFYGYSAKEFRKLLDDLGLKMVSGHTVMGPWHWDKDKNDFNDMWKFTVEDAATMGQQYVVSPWLDESLRKDYDGLLKWMDVFNKSGELCKKSGMKFGYHNHDFEFTTTINNMKLYDVILQHTDPALVAQQLDIGNMYGVGGRGIEIIDQYPGRFELMHVKDEIKSGTKGEMGDGYESTVLGKGVIDVKKIIDLAAAKGGTTHFIIEQESYQTISPVEAVQQDLKVMKSWGY
ncbi:MAG TPA: sugar phosphate isomerase/epimerase family protein [Puia sp.]|nr:sugar phosphate isomerase/epimerase family protein [Puia sp.]